MMGSNLTLIVFVSFSACFVYFKGELGFFDFYIIPLAKKLKECGVFGVSSDEYLNYAIANRAEWASKGENVVKQLVAEVNGNDDDRSKEFCLSPTKKRHSKG